VRREAQFLTPTPTLIHRRPTPCPVFSHPPTRSSIHDHAGAHCFMKILDGSLHEELYNMPQPGEDAGAGPMEPCKVTELKTDSMAYISGQFSPVPSSRPTPPPRRVVSIPLRRLEVVFSACVSSLCVCGGVRTDSLVSYPSCLLLTPLFSSPLPKRTHTHTPHARLQTRLGCTASATSRTRSVPCPCTCTRHRTKSAEAFVSSRGRQERAAK
jgi:hypothetical protein